MSVKECVRFIIADQVKGYTINIAPKGLQCFYDSKKLQLSDGIVLLSKHHFPRPESNKPTLLSEHSAETKSRSTTHQVKDGAEVRAVLKFAKAFCRAVIQPKGVVFFSNTVNDVVQLV